MPAKRAVEGVWATGTFPQLQACNRVPNAETAWLRQTRCARCAVWAGCCSYRCSYRDFAGSGNCGEPRFLNVRSHVDELGPKPDSKERPWLFSRDCFEVALGLLSGKRLTLFINHLKSKFIDTKRFDTPLKQLKSATASPNRSRQTER